MAVCGLAYYYARQRFRLGGGGDDADGDGRGGRGDGSDKGTIFPVTWFMCRRPCDGKGGKGGKAGMAADGTAGPRRPSLSMLLLGGNGSEGGRKGGRKGRGRGKRGWGGGAPDDDEPVRPSAALLRAGGGEDASAGAAGLLQADGALEAMRGQEDDALAAAFRAAMRPDPSLGVFSFLYSTRLGQRWVLPFARLPAPLMWTLAVAVAVDVCLLLELLPRVLLRWAMAAPVSALLVRARNTWPEHVDVTCDLIDMVAMLLRNFPAVLRRIAKLFVLPLAVAVWLVTHVSRLRALLTMAALPGVAVSTVGALVGRVVRDMLGGEDGGDDGGSGSGGAPRLTHVAAAAATVLATLAAVALLAYLGRRYAPRVTAWVLHAFPLGVYMRVLCMAGGAAMLWAVVYAETGDAGTDVVDADSDDEGDEAITADTDGPSALAPTDHEVVLPVVVACLVACYSLMELLDPAPYAVRRYERAVQRVRG